MENQLTEQIIIKNMKENYLMLERSLDKISETSWWNIWKLFNLNIEVVHYSDRYQIYRGLYEILSMQARTRNS